MTVVHRSLRIARLLRHTPESWLKMQMAVDLWRVAQDKSLIAAIKPLPRERIAA